MSIKALIFDMDGVITDTVELHYRAWQRLADEVDVRFDRVINEELRGLSRRDSLELIFHGRELGEEEAAALMRRKNSYFLEQARVLTPDDVLPGVRSVIEQARAQGLKVAVGSSSQNAHIVLERLGMFDAFDVIGDGLTVAHSKPAPDIFLWVAAQLGVHPNEVLVIEDARAGIAAARRGGFYALGVGVGDLTGAHLTLSTLEGVDLRALIGQLPTSVGGQPQFHG
jgi:beta-phosphoglucomutase